MAGMKCFYHGPEHAHDDLCFSKVKKRPLSGEECRNPREPTEVHGNRVRA